MPGKEERSKFVAGARDVLGISLGVIPFGLVMGQVCAMYGYSVERTVVSNLMLYAGTAQLTAIELMAKQAAPLVVIATGLFINARYVLYSAALSPSLAGERKRTKLVMAYLLTDQAYAVLTANEKNLKSTGQLIAYYLGASVVVALFWHLSVVAGYTLGNLLSSRLALDAAIPLSFVALIGPKLGEKKHALVALVSASLAILFNGLPFGSGLLVSAVLGVLLGTFLTLKKGASP